MQKIITQGEREVAELLFIKIHDITGLTKKEIVGKCRKTKLNLARQVMMTILRKEVHLSYKKIGLLLIKDHSTIIYHVKKHIDNLPYPPYNKLYFNVLDRLMHKIKRTDVEYIDAEIERASSEVSNLKHKRRLLMWASRRYELGDV